MEKVAKVEAIRELAPQVLEVQAACVAPARLDYRPGQFLSLRCGPDGSTRRSYSLSSHPSRKGSFELLVKMIPGGVGSRYFGGMQPGDELHFTGPMGFFVPELSHPGDVLFAVTGAGIAAALPMLQEILARAGESGAVKLFWGMRAPGDLYWLDRIDALHGSPRFDSAISLTQPPADWTGLKGRITHHVLGAAEKLRDPVHYLVGHGDMIRDVKEALEARGVDRKRRIRTEVFYPASKPAR